MITIFAVSGFAMVDLWLCVCTIDLTSYFRFRSLPFRAIVPSPNFISSSICHFCDLRILFTLSPSLFLPCFCRPFLPTLLAFSSEWFHVSFCPFLCVFLCLFLRIPRIFRWPFSGVRGSYRRPHHLNHHHVNDSATKLEPWTPPINTPPAGPHYSPPLALALHF